MTMASTHQSENWKRLVNGSQTCSAKKGPNLSRSRTSERPSMRKIATMSHRRSIRTVPNTLPKLDLPLT